jgi:hypothetical protein
MRPGTPASRQTDAHAFLKPRRGFPRYRDTGQSFSLDDPCVFRGTFGADPAAYRAALHAVKALIGTEPGPSP